MDAAICLILFTCIINFLSLKTLSLADQNINFKLSGYFLNVRPTFFKKLNYRNDKALFKRLIEFTALCALIDVGERVINCIE